MPPLLEEVRTTGGGQAHPILRHISGSPETAAIHEVTSRRSSKKDAISAEATNPIDQSASIDDSRQVPVLFDDANKDRLGCIAFEGGAVSLCSTDPCEEGDIDSGDSSVRPLWAPVRRHVDALLLALWAQESLNANRHRGTGAGGKREGKRVECPAT